LRRAQTHAAGTGPPTHPPTDPRIRPLTRVAATAAALAIIILATRQAPSEATPTPLRTPPPSILPTSVGVGIATQQGLSLDFASPMDARSVAGSLILSPTAAVHLAWSEDARHLHVTPVSRWLTDTRYELDLPASVQLANGSVLGAPLRFAFTTETAPTITTFSVTRGSTRSPEAQLTLKEAATDPAMVPADTAVRTSARASIAIGFSATMNRSEVERGFLVSPAVNGRFLWQGTSVTFTPSSRLDPSARYAVAVIGAHDLQGNPLGGDLSFSFNTLSAVRVVKVSPPNKAKGVTARTIRVTFSGPVQSRATGRAFQLVDVGSPRRPIAGSLKWNATGTQLTFTTRSALAAGHRFHIKIGAGSVDADGNSILATFSFVTKAAARPAAQPARASVSYRPVYSAPAPSGSAASYALSLINASRRAYGFAPLRLDSALSAVAQAHATDQVVNNYFSHNSLNGMTPEDRLRAAGISFTRSGENQCYDYGSVTSAIAWCHSVMMAEPYPGYWNHIGNILSPNFTRVGFGYAVKSNGEVIMTWDFAN
jgi:uncharacterized protein YkwD